MKIEAGNWYRTRCGEYAFVGAIFQSEDRDSYPVVGYIKSKEETQNWKIGGEYISYSRKDDNDLIELIGHELPKKPLILQEGYWYKTRDGKKAFSGYLIPENVAAEFRICGYIEGAFGFHTWKLNGGYSKYGCSDNDLIEIIGKEPPIKPLKIIQGNYYKDRVGHICFITNICNQEIFNVDYPVQGLIKIGIKWGCFSWTLKGMSSHDLNDKDNDLIEDLGKNYHEQINN